MTCNVAKYQITNCFTIIEYIFTLNGSLGDLCNCNFNRLIMGIKLQKSNQK